MERAERVIAPDIIVTPAATRADTCLVVGEDGRCMGLLPRAEGLALGLQIDHLPRRAVLSGFVNAHSHVFQRRLRGRTQRPFAAQDSFWTWRRQMYAEAQALTPQSLHAIARSCYREMLRAGYTTVGEFHYVHHAPDGNPYENPLAMAQAILAAAAETGIRLVLLPAAYARAGLNGSAQPEPAQAEPTQPEPAQPEPAQPEPAQRRFLFRDVEAYLRFVDDLRATVHDPRQGVGVAPHSVRAVPEDWLAPIAHYAREQGLVLHVHASEQTAEVEATRRHHGCTPIALLAAHGVLDGRTTLIHATHATEDDCRLIAAAGASVCVCPTTEGDLGDGIAPYETFVAQGIPLAIGSDGQTRIDPLEELRWAEFSARMRYRRRRVLATHSGLPDADAPGRALLAAGTVGGARSLGLDAGSLEPGQWADLIAVDLDHPALAGAAPDDLRDTLLFGAGADVITDVWVGGHRIDHDPATDKGFSSSTV